MTKFNRDDLTAVCREVAKAVKTEDEAHELLRRLAKAEGINWVGLIKEADELRKREQELVELEQKRKEQRRKLEEELRDEILRCPICRDKFPYHQLDYPRVTIRDIPWQVGHKKCCPACQGKVIERRIRICEVCGNQFISKNSQKACSTCWRKVPSNLKRQVNKALDRARKLGRPATLTFPEWIVTVEHFQGLCAYCQRPMEELDHFVPLKRGGGTTVDNCVPSCQICNDYKDDFDPRNEFDRVHLNDWMSIERIDRVGAYLDSKKAIQPQAQTE